MPKFHPMLRAKIVRTLQGTGLTTIVVERGIRKWEERAPLTVCVEEQKGKERGLATDCRCEGCLDRLIAFYCDQVYRRLGPGGPGR